MGYSLIGYGEMINDGRRMQAYLEAMKEVVRPGSVVLDIGAGTGIMSLLACQLGAGHVHSVEPDDAIQLARTMAAANGCAERVTFHQSVSTSLVLPIPADVVISDLRGVLPFFQQHIPAIIDARRRLLAPGGAMLARRDALWAAIVEDSTVYMAYAEPWLHNEYGLDLRAGQPRVVNTWRKVNAKPAQLVVRPKHWATLDYRTVAESNIEAELVWTVERVGTAHGLLLWFDAELSDGVRFSNAPDQPELIYGQAFFPLEKPVALVAGDIVSVLVRADLVSDDYVWQWRTQVYAAGDHKHIKAHFRQSTFLGAPLSSTSLRKREAGYRPVLSVAGQVERFMLSLMDSHTTLREIACLAMQEFPGELADHRHALTLAGNLSLKYGR